MTVSRPTSVQQAVRDFLDAGPRFAQLITVDASGAPVTRTVGAEVGADWTVELVARSGHARLRQLARNPHLQLVFVGDPRSSEPVAKPAVIDYGLPVPRVVVLSGRAEPMSPDDTCACYRRQTERALARGYDRAPARTQEQVRAELAGLRVRVDRVRAEGFGDSALAETWETAPMTVASERGTA